MRFEVPVSVTIKIMKRDLILQNLVHSYPCVRRNPLLQFLS